MLILSRRCPLTSSGPQPKIQVFQHTAPGYSGARRPRRALVTEGAVLRHRGEASVVSSPYSSTRWGLLFWLVRASQPQEKRWGCSLPPPFLSLPLIGSR